MKQTLKTGTKRTLVTAVAALCLTTQLTGCITTAIVAGVAASAIVLSDRRSVADYSKDAWIDIQAATPLGEIGTNKTTHIIANAFNSRVLLTGEVATEADKQQATDAVQSLPGVKGVDNQLTVGPITSLAVRNNDSFITSKVKARLVNDQPELGNAMKVVTENGVVYVFGMLTQSEVERGIEIVRTTAGVQRVVKTSLITIIEAPKAQELDQSARDDAAKTQGTVTPLPGDSSGAAQPVTQPTTQAIN